MAENMKGIGPVLYQRDCSIKYVVRAKGEVSPTDADTLEGAAVVARSHMQRLGERVWIDVVVLYMGTAGNEEAKPREGRGEVRKLTFEVFPDDLVLCPAAGSKLDPKWFNRFEEIRDERAAS